MNTLLQDIEQEISQAGGRYNLARLLTEESPSWFSLQERTDTKAQAYRETLKERFRSPRQVFWTAEDEAYLMNNWNGRSKIKVAHALRRTPYACDRKYYNLKRNKQWKQAS